MNFKAKIREGSIKSVKIAPKFVSCCNDKGNKVTFLFPISKTKLCYLVSCWIQNTAGSGGMRGGLGFTRLLPNEVTLGLMPVPRTVCRDSSCT